jgi:two-component system chemotaxis response regulator CheY
MLKALVIDDSTIVRRNINIILEELGHQVVAEDGTGENIIKLYETFEPDFVTMDITMPGRGGVESVRMLKEKFSDAKVIMVTSHGREKMVMDSLKAGAKAYIIKPVTKEAIEQALDSIFPAK